MKTCGYCGHENEVAVEGCAQCGTLFPRLEPAPGEQVLLPSERPLGAGRALMIFFLYFGIQIVFGIFLGIAIVAWAAVSQGNLRSDAISELLARASGPASILGVVVAGVAMWLVCWRMLRGQLRDSSPTGAAWVVGNRKEIAQGLGIGLLAGVAYCVLYVVLASRVPHTESGPIATMAVTPGLTRWLWLAMALVFAPLIEEPLFRGVVYGGFRKSFGAIWAAIWSTFLFVILHITEMIYFWPSAIGITGLALAALWWRLRSAAIGPAVAVHVGYNAMIAFGAFASTPN